MKYKALAVDIDGTLLCGERPWLTEPCLYALRQLQLIGVPVIVCTGRGGFAAGADTLSGFKADYIVCANGACVLNNLGETIHAKHLTLAQAKTLTEYSIQHGFNLTFAFEDAYYVYSGYPSFVDYYRENSGDPSCLIDCAERTRHLKSLPIGAYALMPPDTAKVIIPAMPELRFMETAKNAFDICDNTTGKVSGLSWLLNRLGLDWGSVVAIGDSANDIEMLRAAGLGIAMGNAPDNVRHAADIVTGTVLEDGILEPLRQFFGINLLE